MGKEYCLCQFKFHEKTRFIIWFSDDVDGVLIYNGKIIQFTTISEVDNYSTTQNIDIELDNFPIYDFDEIRHWANFPKAEFDHSTFLNVWNMFTDLSNSFGNWKQFTKADIRLNIMYQKLFHGNNLPSITPEGKHFIPIWNGAELRKIAKHFKVGLRYLQIIF